MIGNKVDYDLQTGIMRPCHKFLELCNSGGRIVCKVWIDIVIVTDRIRGSGLSFDKLRMRRHASLLGFLS